MRPIEQLKKILGDMITAYSRFLELLSLERTLLVDLNIDLIEDLAKKKDTEVLKIKLLEEERLRLTKEVSDTSSPSPVMDINWLYEQYGDEEFLEIRSKLVSLIQGIQELNEFNRLLIDRSLGYVKNTTQILNALGIDLKDDSKGKLCSWRT